MPITYSLAISGMTKAPSIGEFNDCVVSVTWTVTATDGTYSATTTGTTITEPPHVEDWIAYADLTEADVLNWMPNYTQYTDIQSRLGADIAVQSGAVIEPVDVFPWSV